MACNCKADLNGQLGDDITKEKLGPKITIYTLKFLGFLMLVCTLPIINLVIIWFMFKTLVLSKNVNIKPLLVAIGNKFKESDDDDDDDDIELDELTEDDVEMLDVEDITNKSK